jgi:hypothetical protein
MDAVFGEGFKFQFPQAKKLDFLVIRLAATDLAAVVKEVKDAGGRAQPARRLPRRG